MSHQERSSVRAAYIHKAEHSHKKYKNLKIWYFFLIFICIKVFKHSGAGESIVLRVKT